MFKSKHLLGWRYSPEVVEHLLSMHAAPNLIPSTRNGGRREGGEEGRRKGGKEGRKEGREGRK